MYNSAKAAQIIAYFALKSPARSINMLKSIKLVYIADREVLKRFGFTMLDEPRYSMPHGPVNSRTYDNAKGEVQDEQWSAVLDDRANHQIGVKNGITVDDLDELSDAEIQVMDEIWDKFAHMDGFQLAEWTHKNDNIPEWEDPNGSSYKIPLERMLRAVGFEHAEEHAEFLRDHARIESLLAELA